MTLSAAQRELRSADPPPRLELLLLCDTQRYLGATVQEHIDALTRHSRHRIRPLRLLGDLPDGLDLGRFDGIIIHYSLVACSDDYLSSATRARLAAFPGLKAIFIQDDYRHVDRTIAAMREIGVNVLFTIVPEREIENVYPADRLPGVIKVPTLTGYVPEALVRRAVPAYAERPIEVGYRTRRLPAWLGELGQEKWLIGQRFLDVAERHGLRCDISWREEDRLYGDAWVRFLVSCRAVLGAESGASVCDFTGDIQLRVEAHVRQAPDTSFAELRRLYFAAEDGRIRMNPISPRCFEAAAARTLMVLYPGEYGDILRPGEHYLALNKDHSNIDDVVAVIRDPGAAQEIIDCAYRDIACNPEYGFRRFAELADGTLAAAHAAALGSATARSLPAYDDREFRDASRPARSTRVRRAKRAVFTVVYRFLFGRVLRFLPEARRERAKHRLNALLIGLRELRSGAGRGRGSEPNLGKLPVRPAQGES
jgi:hypothetical protein